MARVLVFHYREAQTGKDIIAALKEQGHHVVDAVPEYPDFEPSLDVAEPDFIVVDCSHNFHKGIEAADYVASRKAYANVPILFANLPEDRRQLARQKVDVAAFVDPDEIAEAIKNA